MRKITVLSMITMDGVMQAPGGPEEDTSGGFAFGGWTEPFASEQYRAVLMEELQPAEYLLGRKTFEIWENYWPKYPDFWPGINDGMKYVLSHSRENTDWQNTKFITSIDDIKMIKQTDGKDLQVWGSSQLVQLLLHHDLVDELRLKIHPVLLGNGKKLFTENLIPASFSIGENMITDKGVIIACYAKAGKVATGIMGVDM